MRTPARCSNGCGRTEAARRVPPGVRVRRAAQRPPFVEFGTALDDASGEGVVRGLKGDFWRLRGGGANSCDAVFDFRIADGRLSTETRVHVADPSARRKFARYWRVIRPFSGLTRILFLREVRRRAEA